MKNYCKCRCHTHISEKADASCCLGKPSFCKHCHINKKKISIAWDKKGTLLTYEEGWPAPSAIEIFDVLLSVIISFANEMLGARKLKRADLEKLKDFITKLK